MTSRASRRIILLSHSRREIYLCTMIGSVLKYPCHAALLGDLDGRLQFAELPFQEAQLARGLLERGERGQQRPGGGLGERL